jgi:hypothetical protein
MPGLHWNEFAHVVYDPGLKLWYADWAGQENRFLDKRWLTVYRRAWKVAEEKGLKGVIVYSPSKEAREDARKV